MHLSRARRHTDSFPLLPSADHPTSLFASFLSLYTHQDHASRMTQKKNVLSLNLPRPPISQSHVRLPDSSNANIIHAYRLSTRSHSPLTKPSNHHSPPIHTSALAQAAAITSSGCSCTLCILSTRRPHRPQHQQRRRPPPPALAPPAPPLLPASCPRGARARPPRPAAPVFRIHV